MLAERTSRSAATDKIIERDKPLPLLSAVNGCDVELLNTVLDSLHLDEKSQAGMVSHAYSHFFQQDYSQITESQIAVVKQLLELGADVNGGPSVLPLCVAAKAGSYPLVELLCQHDADCNRMDWVVGHTPLKIAAQEGRCDLIKLLLKFGANIHDELQTFRVEKVLDRGHTDFAIFLIQLGAQFDIGTILYNAIVDQNVSNMNFLLENCRLETQEYILENKDSLLMTAVRGANVEIVSHILDIGFSVSGENPCWENCLAQSGSGEMARFIIQKGAIVNNMIETSPSESPLYVVLRRNDLCRSSRLQIVQALLENGASPNFHCDVSPLMFTASKLRCMDLLQLLLDYGADINWRNKEGTAFIRAVCKRYHRNVDFVIRYAIDTDFLNLQNKIGLTAFREALKYSSAGRMMAVINHGLDLNVADSCGNAAMLRAINRVTKVHCEHRIEDVVTAVLNAGFDVNWQSDNDLSPLMLATRRYCHEIIKILLDAGTELDDAVGTKTALLYLQPMEYVIKIDETELTTFLYQSAYLTHLQAKMFHRILLSSDIDIISKVIVAGPITVRSDNYIRGIAHADAIFDASPLCAALLDGHVSLAHYFIKIMFLTTFDVFSLMYNKQLHDYLFCHQSTQCMELLIEMYKQPMSLFALAFVSVSSAVGTTSGRVNRVNKLPLPNLLKNKLLFKSSVDYKLTRNTGRSWLLPSLYLDTQKHINVLDPNYWF